MVTREETIDLFKRNGDDGWINLVEMIFDGKPEGIEIREVWEKYAELRVSYTGTDKVFGNLVNKIGFISQKTCQKCGRSGRKTYINGWEIILCDEHYHHTTAKRKDAEEWFYPEDKTKTNQRLVDVSLLVKDYEEALAFYVDKLEFQESWSKTVSYKKRGIAIAPLYHHLAPNIILQKGETPEELECVGKQAVGKTAFTLYTDNLDPYFNRLKEREVNIIQEPQEEEWGKEAIITDLYGNWWNVIEEKYDW